MEQVRASMTNLERLTSPVAPPTSGFGFDDAEQQMQAPPQDPMVDPSEELDDLIRPLLSSIDSLIRDRMASYLAQQPTQPMHDDSCIQRDDSTELHRAFEEYVALSYYGMAKSLSVEEVKSNPEHRRAAMEMFQNFRFPILIAMAASLSDDQMKDRQFQQAILRTRNQLQQELAPLGHTFR